MSLNIVRRIRDNLHGSIDVSDLEDAVIAHPCFQRLRRVKQLAFLHYVFPGATHTRFEHSLGVMHLASRAWEKLEANQQRLRNAVQTVPNFDDMEKASDLKERNGRLWPTFARLDGIFKSSYALQCFRLAALLHDVGHPPFSHSGEHFMPAWTEVLASNPDMPAYLQEYVHAKIAELRGKGLDPSQVQVRHEIYSILIIDRILKDVYTRFPNLLLKIEARDIISVINPAVKPAANSPLGFAYHLLRELISGELDIDRMDYLLRDSRECGVVYGVFDVDRILDSLGLYFDDDDGQIHIAIHLSGLAAFEDYLRARYSMYLQLYFHKSSVAAEAMMRHLCHSLHQWRLPAKVEHYAAIDEYNIGSALWDAAQALPETERSNLEILVADLLFNRRLWKRVYELSDAKKKFNRSGVEAVARLLKAKGVSFQEVSSENSLTRFQPRQGDQRSGNQLRLIKKDEKQVHRVCAIEDFSSLIGSSDAVVICRLYALPDRPFSLAEIKALVAQGLSTQSP